MACLFRKIRAPVDARISGTCASLAGLEKAIHEETEREVELALRRILLIHSVILSIGGIPLIYLGDEIATLNDYRYREDPAKIRDSRWVHRPFTDWEKYNRRFDETTQEGKIFTRLKKLIDLRKTIPAFSGAETDILSLRSKHLFSYVRQLGNERILSIGNFSEQPQIIDGNEIRLHGLGYNFVDLVSGQPYSTINPLMLEPYQFVWLRVVS